LKLTRFLRNIKNTRGCEAAVTCPRRTRQEQFVHGCSAKWCRLCSVCDGLVCLGGVCAKWVQARDLTGGPQLHIHDRLLKRFLRRQCRLYLHLTYTITLPKIPYHEKPDARPGSCFSRNTQVGSQNGSSGSKMIASPQGLPSLSTTTVVSHKTLNPLCRTSVKFVRHCRHRASKHVQTARLINVTFNSA
jgi:hypothetical protein